MGELTWMGAGSVICSCAAAGMMHNTGSVRISDNLNAKLFMMFFICVLLECASVFSPVRLWSSDHPIAA
jgi:hypothetical protein